MKNIFKYSGKIFFSHICSIILTLAIIVFFAWILKFKYGIQCFSGLTSLIYFSLIYSDAWKMGQIENKDYNDIKANPLRGGLASLSISMASWIILILYLTPVSKNIIQIVFCIWFAPMCGFVANNNGTVAWYIVLIYSLIPVLISVLGYFVGTKGFSITEKIQANNYKKAQKKSMVSKEAKKRSFF